MYELDIKMGYYSLSIKLIILLNKLDQ